VEVAKALGVLPGCRIGAPATTVGCFFWCRLQRKKAAKKMRSPPRTPPTAPPAIAPTFVEDELSVEVGPELADEV